MPALRLEGAQGSRGQMLDGPPDYQDEHEVEADDEQIHCMQTNPGRISRQHRPAVCLQGGCHSGRDQPVRKLKKPDGRTLSPVSRSHEAPDQPADHLLQPIRADVRFNGKTNSLKEPLSHSGLTLLLFQIDS